MASHQISRAAQVLAWAATVAVLAACGAAKTAPATGTYLPVSGVVPSGDSAPSPHGDSAPSPPTAAGPAASSSLPAGQALVGTSSGPVKILNRPDGDLVTTLAPRTAYGSARVLAVTDVEGGWAHVQLPTRPNGSTGWVSSTALHLQSVRDSIVIDVDKRTITVTVAGKTTAGPAAVGTDADPTPRGTFYVTDMLRPPAGGAYGTVALGLSAHSDVLTSFAGGDGQIGIHGTNEPASIGKAASHGCIRVGADVDAALGKLALGTPVTIR